MLKYLSERSGALVEANGVVRPLLRVQDLQSLKRTTAYTETYFSAPGVQFVTRLPDISQYASLQYPDKRYMIPCRLPEQPIRTFSPNLLQEDYIFNTINANLPKGRIVR